MPSPSPKKVVHLVSENLTPSLHLIDHDLIQHKLTRLRDKNCSSKEFRRIMREIGLLMSCEVTRNLKPMKTVTIDTHFTKGIEAKEIEHTEAVIAPILRAGSIFADSLSEILSDALIGHIGYHRTPKDDEAPIEYMVKLPNLRGRKIFLTDPVIATGLTARAAIELLRHNGVSNENIVFMSLLVGREAIKQLTKDFPGVQFFFAAIDEETNNLGYLVQGFGPTGDRIFGTEE